MSQQTSIVRPLTFDDLGDFWEIAVLAGSEEYNPRDKARRVGWFHKLMSELPTFTYHGAFRDGHMVGGMATSDFQLNLRDAMVKLSSVGMVATDLLHKREKVCRDLMQAFIRMARERGINMLHLSPFRPDFYKQMGFGYGASLYHYSIPPESFPTGGSKDHLVYIESEEQDAYLDAYVRICRRTHGAIRPYWLLGAFGFFGKGKRVLAYRDETGIRGILSFAFGEDKTLLVEELFYDSPQVLRSFCAFLYSQADQFDRVQLSTPDEHFYYILEDPRDGKAGLQYCTASVNAMFRVVDVAGLFRELKDVDFGDQTAYVRIVVHDTFCSENDGETLVAFKDGKPTVLDITDSSPSIRMSLNIAGFSSLITGAIDIVTLHRLGLLETDSPQDIHILQRIFQTAHKPLATGGL